MGFKAFLKFEMAVICIFHPLPSLARLRITGVWCYIPVGVLAGIRRQSIQHLESEKTLFFVRLLATHSSETSSENRLKRTKDGYFMSLRVSAIPTRRRRAMATLHVLKAEEGKERKEGKNNWIEKGQNSVQQRQPFDWHSGHAVLITDFSFANHTEIYA